MSEAATRRPAGWGRIKALVPWVSLALGIIGALMMDRGPERARVVAIAVAASWIVLLGARLLYAAADRDRSRWKTGIWWTSLAAAQWAIQLALFFSVPFYWRAWAGTLPQLAFVIALSIAALVSLWDPWTERILHRPDLGAALPAIASFAALNAVLPGLGLSNSQSLWASAIATAVALPIGLVGAPVDRGMRRRLAIGTLGAMLFLPGALVVGAARCVPAAPLALIDGAIGTRQESRGVADPIERLDRAPARLLCATAIFAPLGVRERLYHVWRQDGVLRDRIELEISGGREDGYRTWSSKRNFGREPAGLWSCAVETAMGQSLGARTIEIAP